jgi:hypothetical protein
MKWSGKLFKRKKKTYVKDQKFMPLVINDKSELIHEIFGITDERSKELTMTVLESYAEHNEPHLVMIDIISQCKHANEIALVVLLFERVISKQREKNTVNEVMSRLFGDDE